MTRLPVSDEPISSAQAEYDLLANISPEVPCPYLPGVRSRSEAYYAETLDGATHERLITRGFRRSGRIVYRPRCRGCRECRQLRVLTGQFRPTRSTRRVWRRNADLRVELAEPVPTDEKYTMFRHYLDAQHDDAMSRSYESFVEFLYDSPTETSELSYCLGRRVIGISIVDHCPGGLSSVYMYFEPEYRDRSLGTFSVVWEIEYCRGKGLPYYYLGFFVAQCATMAYKCRFRPNEILVGNDRWVAFRE